jgi:glycosyltransferase involved in cell wall biosynthesis
MRTISVLFTNNALDARGGTETYIRDVALALLRRGHRPVAFSVVLGRVAAELRDATIPVIDDPARLGSPPDVIHGHHHLETLIAALAFPETPIVHVCHGWVPWEELPLRHPSIRRYVAVDEVCADRIVREEGIPGDRVEQLLNFVDLDRFQPRGPLPERPVHALVLSNRATVDGYTRAIAAACDAAGVPLDIVGGDHGNATSAPETLLRRYDLVFAKGRTALEALAVGCAVVLADRAGGGPLVTPDNVDRLRSRNFGIRELRHAHDPAWYAAQVAAYHAGRAAEVSARVRAEAGLEPAVDRLLAIYEAAMAAPPAPGDASRAAADHLRRVIGPLKQVHDTSLRIETLAGDLATARGEREDLAGRLAACESAAARDAAVARDDGRALEDRVRGLQAKGSELARLAGGMPAIQDDLSRARHRIETLERQIAAFESLPSLRIRNALLRIPIAGRLVQACGRRLARLLG